ncbi:MAG: exosortase H-associated membrane protein [Candidatus Thiodiazotropha sp.]
MRLKRHNPITNFALRIILWLPFCLLLWYFFAPTLLWPLSILTDWIMVALFPDVIGEVMQLGNEMDVVTSLPLPEEMRAGLPLGYTGDLVFTLNPLIYSYGLPLYTALVIASVGEEGEKWRRWLWGLPLLLLVQLWGVSLDILKTLLFKLGAESANQLTFSPLQKEIVALGYQLGYLILPPVMPVMIWAVFFRDFIVNLVWGCSESETTTMG